jgi:hypothetical protein
MVPLSFTSEHLMIRRVLQAAAVLLGTVFMAEPAYVALFEDGIQPFGSVAAFAALLVASAAYAVTLALGVFAVSRVPLCWRRIVQWTILFLVAMAVLLLAPLAVFSIFLPLAAVCSATAFCAHTTVMGELLNALSVVAANIGYPGSILAAAFVLMTGSFRYLKGKAPVLPADDRLVL